MKIWIVEQSSGMYDDYRSWPVQAFATKAAAEAWVTENNPLFRRKMDKLRTASENWQDKYNALKEKDGLWDEQGSYSEAHLKLREKKPEGEWYDQHGYTLNSDPIPFHA